jgi:predicted transposase/invertase (TIGR01784 family)
VRRVLNPYILSADPASKSVVLDILAEDVQGQRLALEMQLCRYQHWPQRSIYGVARTLASQLRPGQDYRHLKPVIGINLLAHNLFHRHTDQACWSFTLRDQRRPRVHLDSAIQVHIIELRKAERLRKLPAPLRAWVTCLLHNLDEAAMNAITYPPVREALAHLKTICSDEELRLIAERREQALVDYEDSLSYAHHEGKRIGLAKGRRQQRHTLLRMLEHKFGSLPQPFRTRLERAGTPQLETWSLNLLDAKRIEDVFA